MSRRRHFDPKALTTTVAALVACAIMGTAVNRMIFKRPRFQMPSIEAVSEPSNEGPAKTSPQPPKPSRIARGMTA